MTLYERFIEEVNTLETQEMRDYYTSQVPAENQNGGHNDLMEQFLFWRNKTKVRETAAPPNIRQTESW